MNGNVLLGAERHKLGDHSFRLRFSSPVMRMRWPSGRADRGGERILQRGAEIAGIEPLALVREIGIGVDIDLAADLVPTAGTVA